jgi:hypothetical protein
MKCHTTPADAGAKYSQPRPPRPRLKYWLTSLVPRATPAPPPRPRQNLCSVPCIPATVLDAVRLVDTTASHETSRNPHHVSVLSLIPSTTFAPRLRNSRRRQPRRPPEQREKPSMLVVERALFVSKPLTYSVTTVGHTTLSHKERFIDSFPPESPASHIDPSIARPRVGDAKVHCVIQKRRFWGTNPLTLFVRALLNYGRRGAFTLHPQRLHSTQPTKLSKHPDQYPMAITRGTSARTASPTPSENSDMYYEDFNNR